MKTNFVSSRPKKKETTPIKKKEDVQLSNDEHIDQDFPGFPHAPSVENIINPKTEQDARLADMDKKTNKTTRKQGNK